MRYLLLCSLLLASLSLRAQTPLSPEHKKEKAGKAYPNVLSVSPLPLFALEGATYFGIGVEYERFVGAKGRFSVNAPLFAGRIGLQPQTGTLLAFSPGFRYHPAGNTRKLDFSFGPQLSFGRESFQAYELQSATWENITAIMFQLDLDLHAGKDGVIGLYTAWGLYNDSDIPGSAIQLGLKIGGRF